MWHVYLDFTNEGEVFYVGKGIDRRCRLIKRNWLHQIISEEEGFNRAIVFESENEEDCLDLEIQLIKEYHTFYLDPLRSDNACNFTLGGEGVSGYKHTPQALEKLRKLAKQQLHNGTHPGLTGGPMALKNKQLIKRGLFVFQNKKLAHQRTQKRINNGTHNFQGDGSFQTELNNKRVNNGSHHFLGKTNPCFNQWLNRSKEERRKLLSERNKKRYAKWRKANGRPPRPDDWKYL